MQWLVPFSVGAGSMLVLLLAGGLIKRLLRPREPRVAHVLPAVSVEPSLDSGDGSVTGEEIGFAGPEIRLSGVLAPGVTRFEGGEPSIEREERDV